MSRPSVILSSGTELFGPSADPTCLLSPLLAFETAWFEALPGLTAEVLRASQHDPEARAHDEFQIFRLFRQSLREALAVRLGINQFRAGQLLVDIEARSKPGYAAIVAEAKEQIRVCSRLAYK